MRRRLGASLAAVLVAAAVLMTGPATSPAAAQTTICSGVSIKDVQKCDPGWAANMHFMHWNMYRGHNCTNYVAYRLKRDGVPQPSYRLGNADTWAPNARKHGVLVDGKPEVGAVGAWPGRRHVVYIEEIGSNYLITSEDNWPGYYPKGMYRKIKVFKGERAYPTQFIHFKGKSTINGPVPTVSGTPEVGSTLTAKTGTWSPSDVTLKYQWLRDGVIIPGATLKSYTLTSKDVGHAITISVTGSKSGFASRTASSEPTDEVAPKDDEENSSKVVASSTPTVSGTAKRGRTLTGDPGDWGPTGVALAYEWARSDGTVVATDTTTYKVRTADLGHQLVFRVTGSKKSYKSVTRTSRPTETVRATSTLIVTPEAADRGKAVLAVVVSVSNAPTPTGDVTVREGSTKLKTNDLAIGRPGRATLRLTLPRGTHTLTVSYGGSATVAPGSTTVKVKVG